jgi:hypothetical protein
MALLFMELEGLEEPRELEGQDQVTWDLAARADREVLVQAPISSFVRSNCGSYSIRFFHF